ncbi:MAG: hypothetical protein FWD49_07295 [Firmicutes bacterium]|nr:hypothetical protein [Bacillota bacterium]
MNYDNLETRIKPYISEATSLYGKDGFNDEELNKMALYVINKANINIAPQQRGGGFSQTDLAKAIILSQLYGSCGSCRGNYYPYYYNYYYPYYYPYYYGHGGHGRRRY